MKKVGYTWLQEKLNIQGFRLTHESYIGTTDKTELSSTNTVVPDKKIDRMILFLHQNTGKLAVRKRSLYKELSNNEIEQMESAYAQVFQRT